MAELKGELRAEEAQANAYADELLTDRYRDIESKHKAKMIEAKTAVMVNNDLDVYSKALDKALMQFHSMRMRDINEVLKEYWRDTYQGNDIDEVYIKSEETTQIGKTGRRNYNYRVCMKYATLFLLVHVLSLIIRRHG